jgi:hypothetical protein
MDSLQNSSEVGSGSEEEASLEDLVWTLMEKKGLLAELKGRIGKFVQENGNGVSGASVSRMVDCQSLK